VREDRVPPVEQASGVAASRDWVVAGTVTRRDCIGSVSKQEESGTKGTDAHLIRPAH
jgi:hypothetical protein